MKVKSWKCIENLKMIFHVFIFKLHTWWFTAYVSLVKMVVDMELQEAKDYVLQLMKDKDKIESDLKALKEILDIVCTYIDIF